MFCYEGCLGEGRKSVAYLMQALSTYEAINDPATLQQQEAATDPTRTQQERHAISWCFWGFYITEW